MFDALLTRIILFAERHEKPIAIAGWIWFAISCASWIPQVPIPEVPYVTDRNSWMLSGAWNTVWWGFVHPVLEKNREEMRAVEARSDDPQVTREQRDNA